METLLDGIWEITHLMLYQHIKGQIQESFTYKNSTTLLFQEIEMVGSRSEIYQTTTYLCLKHKSELSL